MICQVEYQRRVVCSDERCADDESLGESLGPLLHRVRKVDAELPTIAEELFETWQVGRCADDEYLPDPRKHERRQGIVDHRLVVDGEQLLAHRARDGIQPRARPASEYDASSVQAR